MGSKEPGLAYIWIGSRDKVSLINKQGWETCGVGFRETLR